ncbi:LCP family protein [[Phormidium] sp. ETS-05]|uniref:LCP family protein n=1 Tax=[Phormidium] sp. ETS-05 TaxID=222819 RepID=UPI0018EF0689|nr:LCP family protein [[Phormidium] sp. ETS-05]
MPKKPSRKQQGSLLWLFFGLTGVAMISATAGALLAMSLSAVPFMQSQLSAEDAALFSQENLADTNLQMPQLTRSVNILVLGTKVLDVDLTEERQVDLGYFSTVNSLEGLSDVMLLLRFDPTNNKLVALSIPRDTRTLVEGYGLIKINDANYYGGPALSAKAVSNLLGGVRIDRYVRINVMGVEKLVDALGGVNLYVPSDMKYQDDSQHLYINLKQGQQHLDGEKALQFLRFRNDKLGDIGRIQRQQLMMRALVEQTLNWGTIARLPKIFSAIKEHLDTNLSLEELVALGGFATKINRSNVEMLMVPGDFSDPKQFEASYWLPNLEAIDQMMAAHFDFDHNGGGYQEVAPGSVKIAIQNSTEDWESVDALQKILGDSGYWNSYVSEPWNQPLDKTIIVAQKGDIKSAQAIRDALGVGDVLVESTGSLLSDVTIKVGKDWIDRHSQLQNSPPPTQIPW